MAAGTGLTHWGQEGVHEAEGVRPKSLQPILTPENPTPPTERIPQRAMGLGVTQDPSALPTP